MSTSATSLREGILSDCGVFCSAGFREGMGRCFDRHTKPAGVSRRVALVRGLGRVVRLLLRFPCSTRTYHYLVMIAVELCV
jgi:hypothetical protein